MKPQDNYTLEVNDFETYYKVQKYKKLLAENWQNNTYYCYEYLKYYENETDNLLFFLLRKNDEAVVLMPFLKRKISIADIETQYYDVITPYGYGGPLYNEVNKDNLVEFWKQVDSWYRDNDIVTEFVRFSLTGNHSSYTGELTPTLKNVKGDIKDTSEAQWTSFLPKVRNNYRKSQKHDLTFKMFVGTEINIDVLTCFSEIYSSTMERRNACEMLKFSLKYFKQLVLGNQQNFAIAMAYYEGKPVSGELIIVHSETIYGFLGGTLAEYFQYRPNDFLRVEIIDWARKTGKKEYILGGGRADGDGLYKSKKSLFPKDEDVLFYTGRKTINNEIYNQMNSMVVSYVLDTEEDVESSGFFPMYRKMAG